MRSIHVTAKILFTSIANLLQLESLNMENNSSYRYRSLQKRDIPQQGYPVHELLHQYIARFLCLFYKSQKR